VPARAGVSVLLLGAFRLRSGWTRGGFGCGEGFLNPFGLTLQERVVLAFHDQGGGHDLIGNGRRGVWGGGACAAALRSSAAPNTHMPFRTAQASWGLCAHSAASTRDGVLVGGPPAPSPMRNGGMLSAKAGREVVDPVVAGSEAASACLKCGGPGRAG